jgi:tetratricopeptide (TPR) repeat protein
MALIDKAVTFDARCRKEKKSSLYVVQKGGTREPAVHRHFDYNAVLLKLLPGIAAAGFIIFFGTFLERNEGISSFPEVRISERLTEHKIASIPHIEDSPKTVRLPLKTGGGKNRITCAVPAEEKTQADSSGDSKGVIKKVPGVPFTDTATPANKKESRDSLPVSISKGGGRKNRTESSKIVSEKPRSGLSPPLLINTGLLYFNQKDYATARTFFEKALHYDPENVIAHNNLGLIFYRTDDFENAAKHFRTALEINPDNIETYGNMGILYRKLKKHDEAEKMFLIALKNRPDHPEILYNYALLCRDRGNRYKYHNLLRQFLHSAPPGLKSLKDRVRSYLQSLPGQDAG